MPTILFWSFSFHHIPKVLSSTFENQNVGNVCIAYLSFSESKSQISNVSKSPGPPVISALDAPLSEWIQLAIRSNPNVEWIWSLLSKRLWLTQEPCTITARKFLMSGDSQAVSPQPPEESSGKFRLVEYAAAHWLFHYSELDPKITKVFGYCSKLLLFIEYCPLFICRGKFQKRAPASFSIDPSSSGR